MAREKDKKILYSKSYGKRLNKYLSSFRGVMWFYFLASDVFRWKFDIKSKGSEKHNSLNENSWT